MKICIIGSRGHSGGYVLDELPELPGVSVVGISSGTAEDSVEQRKAWCEEHGHQAKVYGDYRAMLDAGPDAAVIDGPFDLHEEMCVAAIERGIHVFCEKPIALTMEGLERIEKALAINPVQVIGMMGLRYRPPFYAAWRQVQAGAIGAVRMINARKSYRLGKRPPFFHRRATYGGTIGWVGSHAIDWIMWYSGERFESVHAVHTARDNGGHGEMEMTALCQFTMSNDVFASAGIDYLRPATAPTHGDDQVRIAGTAGVVEARHGEAFLINADAEGEQKLPLSVDRTIFGDFVKTVTGGNGGLITTEQTLECTRACLLATLSADEKRIVEFDK